MTKPPGRASLVRSLTLGHRANTGEDVVRVELAAGAEVTVMSESTALVLVRDAQGRLFNVPREALQIDPPDPGGS